MKFRHKHVRVSRASRATVVAGSPGHHVLLEVQGQVSNRVMCMARSEANLAMGKVAYFEPGTPLKDGEPVGVRALGEVYLASSDRLVFVDHLNRLEVDSETGRPKVVGGLEVVRLCEGCRLKIRKAGRFVVAL